VRAAERTVVDRRHLENVLPQIGCCGIWCGSCVVGNGALMELARRYREMVELHGLEHWGAVGFDYAEFTKGLKSVSELDVCSGCRAGGGRDHCELRECSRDRELYSCVGCSEFPDCAQREVLKHMRSGARGAGLSVIESGTDAERISSNGERELSGKWWWRALFED
jgi:hypothetical protein